MSLRLELTKENMDLVMNLVRKLDLKPNDVINMLLENPSKIIEARSRLDGEGKETYLQIYKKNGCKKEE